jgi:hypothetical protein
VTNKIRSVGSPLIKDGEKWLIFGGLDGSWIEFLEIWVLGRVQRRGTDVNPLKIGSRDGVKCFGGISGFYAELRRECFWRNWNLVIFGVLLGDPRRGGEEGGPLCVPFVCLGEFKC